MTSLSLCSGAGLVCFLQSQKIKCNVATNLPPAVPEPGPGYLPLPGAPRESHPGTPRESHPGTPREPHPGASQATAGLGCPRKGSERNTTSQPPPPLWLPTNISSCCHRHKPCSQRPCPAPEPGARLQPVPRPPWLVTGPEPGSRLGTRLQAHRPAEGLTLLFSSPLLQTFPQFKCWKKSTKPKPRLPS